MRVYPLIFVFLGLFLVNSCANKRNSSKGNQSLGTVSSSTATSNSTNKSKTTELPAKKTVSTTGLMYIDRYKAIAISEMNKYGIPASIKLAQALLESGNGNSSLAVDANNHFGIKCGGVWKGRSVTKSDDNPNDCFRVYDNPEQSFRDHSEFLMRKRYEKLFTLDKDDYKGWAYGLKQAGYATNPRYPELLISLIERYELYQYDRKDSFFDKKIREEKVETIIEEKIVHQPVVKAESIKSPVAMVIHEVKATNTLYSISKQYNVTVDQIKQLNNLNTDNISIGQLLLIAK